MKVKNINWFQGTIIKGGCSLIRNHSSHQSIPINHEKVLQELGGVDKTIAECIFDLVNTANLSGGLICPGNSLWFCPGNSWWFLCCFSFQCMNASI